MIIAALLFVLIGISSVLTNKVSENIFSESAKQILYGDASFNPPNYEYIAVVRIEGTIQEQVKKSVFSSGQSYLHTTTMEYIDQLIKDPHNKGMLLYVDSPGGAVYESEEIYNKLMEYKEKTERPIWDYMAHYAASGGYMASVAADVIYANPNTTTGSIGVIMSGYDMTGLYEKLGIRYISITSGENKDSTKMTQEQIDIYQSQINEIYESFVDKVATGRNMSVEDVKELADGRTYTTKQAIENGLVDESSSYEDMKKQMEKELGVASFYEMQVQTSSLEGILTEMKSLVPKSEAQVLIEEAGKMESGVPMYYAEQLQ